MKSAKMENKEGYYMNIPATVWNTDLTHAAQLMYGHITVLSNKEGFCYANNKYFERVLRISTSSVTRYMNQLEKLGLIRRELIYKEGTKEVAQRRIYMNTAIIAGEHTYSHQRSEAMFADEQDNTTRINNTSNNTNITDDERLLDKVIEKYPGNVGSKKPILKALKQLTTEEKKLSLINLDRYSKAWLGYHHNLRNYIEGKQFLDIELKKRETKSTYKDITNVKTFNGTYDAID